MDKLSGTTGNRHMMNTRFRGFLPVVVDVETGGFNAATDALLEIAAVVITREPGGDLKMGATFSFAIEPFVGANINSSAIAFHGIKPDDPERQAVNERDALTALFGHIRRAIKAESCQRAVLVGHNASFDLGFLNVAVERQKIKRNPFHPFSTFDTVTLSGMAYGQTVLAKAVQTAGIVWENSKAHSARYDAEKTAELFCTIVNRWDRMSVP